tara:strand:- start:270 stop:485 length:216 start_codon:yes stop_codon:yes gene_type:complete
MKNLLFLKEQLPLLIRVITLHTMIFITVMAPLYADVVHGNFQLGLPFTTMFGIGGFIYMMYLCWEVNQGNL